MAYTLTQARPLLTAAELELFDQSRAEPIKRLTPADLAGAVKRTRTLRDKYRDLYRRQTVAVRTDAPGAVTGDDNERTQRKADILQEVLERYEARATLLDERGSKAGSKSGSQAKAKGTAASGKAAAQSGADQDSVKKDSAAPKKAAKGAAAAPAAKAGAKASKTSKTTKPAKSASSAKESSVSAQLNTLAGAGASASADADSAPPRKAGSAPARSSKAPSRKAPTASNKASAPDVNAPLDTVPAAKRASPLKQDPGNIAIHAHQSSRGRRTQGKRDSR